MKEEFRYQPMFRIMGSFLVVLFAILWVVIITAILIDQSSLAGNIPTLIAITVFCAGFILFGWWMAWSFKGIIELDQLGITQNKGSKRISISYDKITSVSHQSRSFNVLVVESLNSKITVNKNLINYLKFFEILQSKIPSLMQQEQKDELILKCKYIEAYICFGVFALISLGITGIFWYTYLSNQSSLALFIIMNLTILPFGAFLTYMIFTYPRNYSFRANQIIMVALTCTKAYCISDISKAAYGQRIQGKGTRYPRISTFIEFQFNNKNKSLCIDNGTTDFPIEKLVEYVKINYGLGDRLTEVTLEKDKEARNK